MTQDYRAFDDAALQKGITASMLRIGEAQRAPLQANPSEAGPWSGITARQASQSACVLISDNESVYQGGDDEALQTDQVLFT